MLAIGVVLTLVLSGSVNLSSLGAIRDDSSWATGLHNAALLQSALSKNHSTVVVDGSYWIGPVAVFHANDVKLVIKGALHAVDNQEDWPSHPFEGHRYQDVLMFVDSSDLEISGSGTIDGQGHSWWNSAIVNSLAKGERPHLIRLVRTLRVGMFGLTLKDSPMFHVKMDDVLTVRVRFVSIVVDTAAQKSMLHRLEHFFGDLPTFPLNTDGFDPAGSDIIIQDINVENFDDAVAVKPQGFWSRYSNCSSNILVERATVKYGVGMTIGSIAPSADNACIANVVFRDIKFVKPFKAIYIKTNPGDIGHGIVKNITYENILVEEPLWWPVYIGPQQQKQPDGTGPGCMLYPLDGYCPTQPRVSVSDVVLRNVEIKHALLGPGIVRCDPSNPCSNFSFENVRVNGLFVLERHFICENTFVAIHDVVPPLGCKFTAQTL